MWKHLKGGSSQQDKDEVKVVFVTKYFVSLFVFIQRAKRTPRHFTFSVLGKLLFAFVDNTYTLTID